MSDYKFLPGDRVRILPIENVGAEYNITKAQASMVGQVVTIEAGLNKQKDITEMPEFIRDIVEAELGQPIPEGNWYEMAEHDYTWPEYALEQVGFLEAEVEIYTDMVRVVAFEPGVPMPSRISQKHIEATDKKGLMNAVTQAMYEVYNDVEPIPLNWENFENERLALRIKNKRALRRLQVATRERELYWTSEKSSGKVESIDTMVQEMQAVIESYGDPCAVLYNTGQIEAPVGLQAAKADDIASLGWYVADSDEFLEAVK